MGLTVGEIIGDADGLVGGLGLRGRGVGGGAGDRACPSTSTTPSPTCGRSGSKIPGAQPSLLLDHLAGRRSEIDAINGAIPGAAAEVGLAAPVNATIAALVKVKEQAF